MSKKKSQGNIALCPRWQCYIWDTNCRFLPSRAKLERTLVIFMLDWINYDKLNYRFVWECFEKLVLFKIVRKSLILLMMMLWYWKRRYISLILLYQITNCYYHPFICLYLVLCSVQAVWFEARPRRASTESPTVWYHGIGGWSRAQHKWCPLHIRWTCTGQIPGTLEPQAVLF